MIVEDFPEENSHKLDLGSEFNDRKIKWRSREDQLTDLDLKGWFRWAINEPRDVRELSELKYRK